MDAAQFDHYVSKIDAQTKEAKNIAVVSGNSIKNLNLFKAIANQTNVCDGENVDSLRLWLREIDLARGRLQTPDIVELASRTVSGALRVELEKFIAAKLPLINQDRTQIDWVELKKHITSTFLSLDDDVIQKDNIEKITQAVFETDLQYTRRFSEAVENVYPQVDRSQDREKMLVKIFLRGLLNDLFAKEIVTHHNPKTVVEAISTFQRVSSLNEQYIRLGRPHLGRTTRQEEPMDCSAVLDNDTGKKLDRILASQEKLCTRVAKLEVRSDQARGAIPKYQKQVSVTQKPTDFSPSMPNTPRSYRYRTPAGYNLPPQHTPLNTQNSYRGSGTYKNVFPQAGSPRQQTVYNPRKCFICGLTGHYANNCRQNRNNPGTTNPPTYNKPRFPQYVPSSGFPKQRNQTRYSQSTMKRYNENCHFATQARPLNM